MFTPFTGLSVFVHLVIIGLAKMVHWFRKSDRSDMIRQPHRDHTALRQKSNHALSLLLIGAISAYMLFLLGITLQTSIRVGSPEWHRQYISREIAKLREIQFDSLQLVLQRLSDFLAISRNTEAQAVGNFERPTSASIYQ